MGSRQATTATRSRETEHRLLCRVREFLRGKRPVVGRQNWPVAVLMCGGWVFILSESRNMYLELLVMPKHIRVSVLKPRLICPDCPAV